MKLGIEGKLALITGSTRGIGRAIAEEFINEKVKVILHGRNIHELEKVKKSINCNNVYAVDGDLGLASGVQEFISKLQGLKLYPDIIVNNVGGSQGLTDPLDSAKQLRSVMQLNLEAAIEINRAFIPHMQRGCDVSAIFHLFQQLRIKVTLSTVTKGIKCI